MIFRASVAKLKDHVAGIRELGGRLGVALVVEGSVRRQNGRVRILAQAVDVSTESSVWSEVYDLYLKARYLWSHRTDDSMRQGLAHLERALELDPGFALAHAAVALTHATMGLYGIAAPDRSMGLALAEAKRALELKSGSSEALVARGCA